MKELIPTCEIEIEGKRYVVTAIDGDKVYIIGYEDDDMEIILINKKYTITGYPILK